MEAATEDDDEPTALWDPIFDDSQPGVDAQTGPLDALPDDWSADSTPAPSEPRNSFAAAPTGGGLPATAPARPKRTHRALASALLLLCLGVAGGLIARALDDGSPGGAGLVLRVDPPEGAQVYLDGEPMEGPSPLVLSDLAPGAYEIRVERPGYAPWIRTVVLETGPMQELDATLVLPTPRSARLRVLTVPPNAELRVNGRAVDEAERADYLEVPSSRKLHLIATRDGYRRAEATVVIGPGLSSERRLVLEPTPGSLFIDSTPPGEVYLNGRRVGRTPYEDTRLDVRTPWRVKVAERGYRAHEETIRFGDRRVVQIDATLRRR